MTKPILGVLILAATVMAVAAPESGVTDSASAMNAAKRYMKTRCTAETPCKFKPEHEGKQWRVWVQLTRRNSPNAAPQPYPGGTVILYFDEDGSLKRRLEGD